MCVLRVTGKQFDVDFYLAKSGLTACDIFHGGEPGSSVRPDTWTSRLRCASTESA
jgi:hypothetical protein